MCHHKIMIMDSFELKKITHKVFNSSNVTTKLYYYCCSNI